MQTQNLQIIPKGVKPIIRASQFDVGREFELKLYDGATAYTPPTGTTLRLEGVKPDGTVFSYTENLSLSGSTITVTTTTQMTIMEGVVSCEIRMTKDNDDVGTINFDLIVEKSPINESTDLSQTEVPALVTLARIQMENAEAWAVGTKDGEPVSEDDPQYQNSAKYWANQVGGQTQDAEAWAVGTKDGVPVTSEDDQYHNNSKYYSEQASASAQGVETYALKSEGYALGKQNGTDVTSESPYYHNNAAYFAGQASASATSAGNAADRAEAAVVKEPYIGANGNWFVYDFDTSTYVDTNVAATGPAGADGQDGQDGAPGATGNGIASITKTGTSGLVDTYTILYTNGQSTTFTVTNGANGTGAGDMLAADYDPTSAVYNAGGIVAYVAAQLSLSGLSDVDLTNLANGQTLAYDSTTQKWVNTSLATVATSGSYTDLNNKPTLGTAAAKDSTNAVTQNSTDLVESGAVYTETNGIKTTLGNVEGSIAPVEDGATLSQGYAVGAPFIRGGVLYKAKVALTSGTSFSSLTLDTDYELETKIVDQLSSLNSALSNKADSSTVTTLSGKAYQTDDTAETTLDDADYVPFYDTSATAKRKSLWSNIKSVLKTYFDTLYATISDLTTLSTAVTNKHKVTTKTVNTSSWSTDTTSQSGTTLYKKSISLNHVYVDSPSVDIGTSSGTGLPTAAQQTAYDLLQYVTVDGTTMYLYASAVPSSTYYIQIEGVD